MKFSQLFSEGYNTAVGKQKENTMKALLPLFEEMYMKFSQLFSEGYNTAVGKQKENTMKALLPLFEEINKKLKEVDDNVNAVHQNNEELKNYVKECVNEALKDHLGNLQGDMLQPTTNHNSDNSITSRIEVSLKRGDVDQALAIALTSENLEAVVRTCQLGVGCD